MSFYAGLTVGTVIGMLLQATLGTVISMAIERARLRRERGRAKP